MKLDQYNMGSFCTGLVDDQMNLSDACLQNIFATMTCPIVYDDDKQRIRVTKYVHGCDPT